jgi:predicted HicB family RNase H-like nuclease
MMEYKVYIGKVEFDDEAGIFHGEVINTPATSSRFSGDNRCRNQTGLSGFGGRLSRILHTARAGT